ncbi:MAG: hypothetical protein WA190_02165 [Usitatibacter sp.]
MPRFVAILFVVAAMNVHAEGDAPTYAILSLLGDRITVVVHGQQTGTSFAAERRNVLKLTSPELDKAVLLSADKALRACAPGAKPTLLLTQSPDIYDSQAKVLDSDSSVEGLLPAVLPLVAPSQSRYLILVTKVRYDAQVVIRTGNVAFGKLEGLGFYMDTERPMYNTQTGEEYRGLIAPYVHFRASLVDVASQRVVKEQAIHVATLLPSAAGIGAWDSIPASQKIAALSELLNYEVDRAVRLLMAPAPRK